MKPFKVKVIHDGEVRLAFAEGNEIELVVEVYEKHDATAIADKVVEFFDTLSVKSVSIVNHELGRTVSANAPIDQGE